MTPKSQQPRPRLRALSPLSLAFFATVAQAQGVELIEPESRRHGALKLVFVTANPLGDKELISPTSSIDGEELLTRTRNSLGDTLNGLPGVSTSTYGPMVGRPIIRGLDGDRIRVLQNGVAAFDASTLSFDHAVPQEPLTIERVEIVRGPAALLYGGNAIGGVVNTIDNRIPREAITGLTGAVDASYGGANTARAGAAKVEGGNGRFAFHVDAFDRQVGKQRVPGYVASEQERRAHSDHPNLAYRSIPNSNGGWSGGAVGGGAYTWADGFAGLSYNGYKSAYGSVAEDSVRLRMRQDRVAFASEVRNLQGPFSQFKADFAYTDYEHREIENGITGTTFKNNGYEMRLEAKHRPLGPFTGAVGVQLSENTFSALGAEALAPSTRTTNMALFGLEEWQVDDALKLSVGGRIERIALRPNAAGNERFSGAHSRNFTTGGLSFGALYKLTPVWSVAANAAYTERAPTFYELYANGPHAATGQYLIGNPLAPKEKAVSTDLALRYANGPNKGNIGVFYNRFTNYISETNTGRVVDDEGEVEGAVDSHEHVAHCGGSHDSLKEATYRSVRAEFYGVEASGKWRVHQKGPSRLDVEAVADYTHARNLDNGQPLPRISPFRTTLALDYGYGRFGARAQLMRAWAQKRVPENDLTTKGFTSLGLTLTYKFRVRKTHWLAYVKGDNLTNQEIRYASSIVRDIAPEGGRSVMVGLRSTF